MTDYDNTNRGVLFKNFDKKEDTHADYNGTINVNGEEFWLNAWLKTSKNKGIKFMSLSIKPKNKERQPETHPQQPLTQPDFDDEIPF